MYVSGVNAHVCLFPLNESGVNEKVLDAVSFHFRVISQKLPLYGYKSTKFDAVADGVSIIQGQLAININSPLSTSATDMADTIDPLGIYLNVPLPYTLELSHVKRELNPSNSDQSGSQIYSSTAKYTFYGVTIQRSGQVRVIGAKENVLQMYHFMAEKMDNPIIISNIIPPR